LIEAPREDLKAIQRRIADLLQRVSPPEFLFSPVKGRSYIDNAAAHVGASEVSLLDIVDYFGKCRAQSVYDFFLRRMKCSPDVAYMLAGLTTRDGHLPQGSPCSPVLSFYSCLPMWEEIGEIVRNAGCKITIYVDDLTISGECVSGSMLWEIKATLRKYGFTHNRKKERKHVNKAAEVTGLMVARSKFCVPHRHHRKLLDARQEVVSAGDDDARDRAAARARSLEYQIQALARRRSESAT
jgi:hypothetical protein